MTVYFLFLDQSDAGENVCQGVWWMPMPSAKRAIFAIWLKLVRVLVCAGKESAQNEGGGPSEGGSERGRERRGGWRVGEGWQRGWQHEAEHSGSEDQEAGGDRPPLFSGSRYIRALAGIRPLEAIEKDDPPWR